MNKKFIIEQLEERLMLSADFLPVPFDGGLPYDDWSTDLSVVETPLVPSASASDNAENAELQRHELVFIDARVPEYQKLVNDIMAKQDNGTHFEVIVLDSSRDGIEQMSETLNKYTNIDAVHMFSHGSDGEVQLGDTWLSLDALDAYADSIEGWKSALTNDADLLFYGCDLAAGVEGQALIDNLTILTGADVAASTDQTGHDILGGDWDLEYEKGEIDVSIAVSNELQKLWDIRLSGAAPAGGYTAVDVIPEAQITQVAGAGGDIIITWKGIDAESNPVTLHSFQYSDDDGNTWYTPSNGDNSNCFSNDWQDNGGAGWSTATTFGAAADHSFTFRTTVGSVNSVHSLNGVDQSDIQVKFILNDGTSDSAFLISESFRVDNESPTATITGGSYDASTDTLTITGTNFNTIAADSTDITSYVNWNNLTWDINNDLNSTANISFDGSGVSNLTVTNDTTLTLVFTGAKATAIEANPDYGAAGGDDSLTVKKGFINDYFGNKANTDGLDRGPLVITGNPVLTAPGAAITYTTLDPATVIDSLATVTDIDSPDFNSGTLTVSFSSGGTVNDELSILPGGNVTLDGNEVEVSGIDIGIWSGGTGGTDLLITWNANSTVSDAQEVLRQIAYRNTSGAPDTSTRVVDFVLTDGDGGTSNTVQQQVNFSAANQAPVITMPGAAANFTEGGPQVRIDPGATVTDLDSLDFDIGTLTVSISANGTANDNLSILAGGNVSLSGPNNIDVTGFGTVGTYSGGTAGTPLVITWNATSTEANAQEVLQRIAFSNSSVSPSTNVRTIDFIMTDGDGGTSITVQQQVNVISVNDDPTLTSFTTFIDTTNEDTEVEVTLAELIAQGDENDVDGTVDAFVVKSVASGTLKIGADAGSATAWAAGTNDTIDATNKAYWTPDQDANGTLDAFDVVAKDNQDAESTTGNVTAQIDVTPDNDAPSISATASDTGTEDTDQVYTHAEMLTLIGATDVDDVDANLSISITNVVNGTVALSGGTGGASTTFTLTPTLNFVGNMTFDYQVSDDDSDLSAVGTATVALSADNDAPVGGYTVNNVIPQAQITQATDGSGIITITWKGTDVELNSVMLKNFQYSNDGGSTWYTPNNNDLSGALSPNWSDNGGGGWSTTANLGTATEHNFTFNTKHADVAAPSLDNVDQNDIKIRFTLNDGTDDSATPVTSEAFRVDNEITPTITDAHFHGGGNYLHVRGSNFNTVAPDNTDIKLLVDWNKIIWNINGGPGTITFVQSDILSAEITKDDEFKIYFTAAKEIAMEAIPDFGSDGGADTLTVIPGFFRDAFGNVATTDGTGSSTPPDATNLNANETYTEDTLHNFINDIVTSDPDSSTLTVSLKLSDPSAGDLITGTAGTATSTFDTVTGIWAVSGDIADVNTLLGNLEFDPAQDYDSDFTITASVSDGISAPKTGTITMTATPDNDAPEATAKTVSTTEDIAYTFTASDFTYTDVESNALVSATITNLNLAGGTLTHSGGTTVNSGDTLTAAQLNSLVYDPAPQANGAPLATFDFTVNDADAGTVAAQMNIDVSAQNDAPQATANTVSTNEDTAYTFKAADFTFTDVESNSLVSVTITNMNLGGGTLKLNGVDVNNGDTLLAADIDNLVYMPADEASGAALATFDFTANDADLGTVSAQMDIDVSAQNDTPQATANTVSTNEDTPYTFKEADFTFTDMESNSLVSVTITNQNLGGGTLQLSGMNVNNGDTISAANIGNLVYSPANDANGASLATFDFTVNDADPGTIAARMGIDVSSVADTPQAGNTATLPDTLSDPIVISPNASDGVEVSHFQITGITNGTLYQADGTTEINNGDYITLTQAQDGLKFQLASNTAFGSFNVRPSKDGVSVDPGSGSASPIIAVLSSPTVPDADDKTDEPVEEEEEIKEETIADDPVNDATVNNTTHSNTASQKKSIIKSYSSAAKSGVYQSQVTVDFKPVIERLSNIQENESSNILSALSLEQKFNKIMKKLPDFRTTYESLKNSLDDFRKEADIDMQESETVIGSAIAVSTGLSVGYVVWMIRGGMLLSSLISSMPAWQIADPLPILKNINDEDDDDESLESIIKKQSESDDKKEHGPGTSGDLDND